MKVRQTTVLRKRSVKTKPCMENIDDYDLYFQEAVSREIGCIPPFWSYRIKENLQLEECTSLEKLREVRDIISNFHRNVHTDFQRPCLDMFNSIVWYWTKQWTQNENFSFVEILYVDKYYEEITQVEEFGFQDFWANLGGFIGIFLGYSMMQIPELLCKQVTMILSSLI